MLAEVAARCSHGLLAGPRKPPPPPPPPPRPRPPRPRIGPPAPPSICNGEATGAEEEEGPPGSCKAPAKSSLNRAPPKPVCGASRRRQPVPRGAIGERPVALSAGGLQQAVPSHRLGERHRRSRDPASACARSHLTTFEPRATPPPSSLRPDPPARIRVDAAELAELGVGRGAARADWCAADGAARGGRRRLVGRRHRGRLELVAPELRPATPAAARARAPPGAPPQIPPRAPSHRRTRGQQRQRRLPAREPPLQRPEARVAGKRVVQPIKVLEAARDHAGGLLRSAVDAR